MKTRLKGINNDYDYIIVSEKIEKVKDDLREYIGWPDNNKLFPTIDKNLLESFISDINEVRKDVDKYEDVIDDYGCQIYELISKKETNKMKLLKALIDSKLETIKDFYKVSFYMVNLISLFFIAVLITIYGITYPINGAKEFDNMFNNLYRIDTLYFIISIFVLPLIMYLVQNFLIALYMYIYSYNLKKDIFYMIYFLSILLCLFAFSLICIAFINYFTI